MWRSSLWDDFACMWTGFNSPLRHFFLSFFPLVGLFVFVFLTIKYLLPIDMFSLFMHSAGPLWLREVLPVKRISSLTLKRTNPLRVERLQRGINTKFCSNSVQSNHSGNESLINGCVIGCLPFSMGKPVAPRLYISPRNRIYHLYESVPFIGKRSRRPETGIKDRWFEEMEHKFPFEIFRPNFQMFRCSRKFSAGTRTQKGVFHLLFNRIFRNLFVNGKQP